MDQQTTTSFSVENEESSNSSCPVRGVGRGKSTSRTHLIEKSFSYQRKRRKTRGRERKSWQRDMAEEESSSTVGSPFHQVGSSCSASQPVGNNNANALCLFYSASSNSHNGYNSNASSSGHHLPSYGIQSSRASNSWIASLRSKTNDQSPTRY